MGKKRDKRKGRAVQAAAAGRAAFWIFAAWALFILAKTYAGSSEVLVQGLSFFLFPALSGARAVPAGALLKAHFLSLFAFLPIVLAAQGFGALAVDRLIKDPMGSLERSLLSQGAGLALLALMPLALGLAGGPSQAACLLAVAAGLGAYSARLFKSIKARLPAVSPERPGAFQSLTPLEWTLGALTAYAGAIHFVGALGPETFYDSLVYHLAIPQLFLVKREIAHVPGLLHSGFPLNMEMLYMFGLAMQGETTAKLLHFWMTILTVAAIYGFGKSAANRRAALAAAALFATVPVVGAAAWHTGVELGAAFWSLLGAWTMIRAVFGAERPGGDGTVRWMILSGAFHGAAMGTKYTGIWGAAASVSALAFWLARGPREERRARGAALAAWLAGAVALVAPWLLKNALAVGNPVYPFLTGLFGGPGIDIAAFTASARGHFWHGGALDWRTWILLPWELFTKGRSAYSFIGPLLVLFAPLALLVRRTTFPFGWLLALFGLRWVLWSAETSMVRLLIPALPLFCLYAAHALTRLDARSGERVLWLVVPAALWGLSWNAAMLNEKEVPAAVLGYERPAEFRMRPHHGYHAPLFDIANRINRGLPREAKILIVGDARRYPIARETVAETMFDRSYLAGAALAAADAQALFDAVKGDGITHVVLSRSETRRLAFPKFRSLPPEKAGLIADFWRGGLSEVYRDRFGSSVFTVNESYSAPPGHAGVAEALGLGKQ